MSRRKYFYGTRADIITWVSSVQEQVALAICLIGAYDEPNARVFETVGDIPSFGVPRFGNWSAEDRYLFQAKSSSLSVREVKIAGAASRFFVDPASNPKSIVLAPGGEYGNRAVLTGELVTTSKDGDAIALFNHMDRALSKAFRRIEAYVGENAYNLASNGWRLTGNVSAPSTNDLRVPGKGDNNSLPDAQHPDDSTAAATTLGDPAQSCRKDLISYWEQILCEAILVAPNLEVVMEGVRELKKHGVKLSDLARFDAASIELQEPVRVLGSDPSFGLSLRDLARIKGRTDALRALSELPS